MSPCRNCGWKLRDADWGRHNGLGTYPCDHARDGRYCDSCSSYWWQVGMAYAEGCDGETKYEDCPECKKESQ